MDIKSININMIKPIYEITQTGMIILKDLKRPLSKDMYYQSSNGYDYVLLELSDDFSSSDKRFQLFRIDILIASTYLPVHIDKTISIIDVKHKDGDTHNCTLSNLEWVEFIEEWLPVVHKDIIDNMFEVSNVGNIRDAITKEHKNVHKNVDGYMVTYIQRSKIRNGCINENVDHKTYYVHRLVANAFYGHSELFVNHINGNKSDNHITNLEYVTNKDNLIHAGKTGILGKITPDERDMIKRLLIKYRYPKLAYNIIDHNKHPEITMSIIYNIQNQLSIDGIQKRGLTVEEMDMIRDLLIENGSRPALVYQNLDKNKYPFISLDTIKDIKRNKGRYNISNKYDLNKLIYPEKSFVSKFTIEQLDEIRDLLNKYNGDIQIVIKNCNCNANRYDISNIKNGKYHYSNRFNLIINDGKYPFIEIE